jgi:hypothetical protein
MKILIMKVMILQVETHPMMKVAIWMMNQIMMMKTMVLMLRTTVGISFTLGLY